MATLCPELPYSRREVTSYFAHKFAVCIDIYTMHICAYTCAYFVICLWDIEFACK